MRKPYLLLAGALSESTYTFEEATACARVLVDLGLRAWADMAIRHDDGRRWYWEMVGPNVTLKVDTP